MSNKSKNNQSKMGLEIEKTLNQNLNQKIDPTYMILKEKLKNKLIKDKIIQLFLILYGTFSLIIVIVSIFILESKIDRNMESIFFIMKILRILIGGANSFLIFLLAFKQMKIVYDWNKTINKEEFSITQINYSIIKDVKTLLKNIIFTIILSLILLTFLIYIQTLAGKEADINHAPNSNSYNQYNPLKIFQNLIQTIFLIIYIIVEMLQYKKWNKIRKETSKFEKILEKEIPEFHNLVIQTQAINKN